MVERKEWEWEKEIAIYNNNNNNKIELPPPHLVPTPNAFVLKRTHSLSLTVIESEMAN